jgi:hypothetical protein
VPQAVERGRENLQAPEQPVHPAGRGPHENPRDRQQQQRAQNKADQRRNEDEGNDLQDAGGDQRPGSRLGYACANDAADQRMRGGRGNAVVPGDDVPGDGADQRAEHHVVVDDTLVDDAFADRGRDMQLEYE